MVTARGDDILRFNAATFWSVLTFHTKAKLPQFQAWTAEFSSVSIDPIWVVWLYLSFSCFYPFIGKTIKIFPHEPLESSNIL